MYIGLVIAAVDGAGCWQRTEAPAQGRNSSLTLDQWSQETRRGSGDRLRSAAAQNVKGTGGCRKIEETSYKSFIKKRWNIFISFQSPEIYVFVYDKVPQNLLEPRKNIVFL
jgi:hypothetical protein